MAHATNTTKTTAGSAAKKTHWCISSGAIYGERGLHAAVCPDCAQTVPVEQGVILAHADAKHATRKRLDVELAQLEVAHAEKDLALAKVKLAKALKAVSR